MLPTAKTRRAYLPVLLAVVALLSSARANMVMERYQYEPRPVWSPERMIRWFAHETDHQRLMTESRARIAGVKNREAELLRRAPWVLAAFTVTRWYIARAERAVNYRHDNADDILSPRTGVYRAEVILDTAEVWLLGIEHAHLEKPIDLVRAVEYWYVEVKPLPIDIPEPTYPEQTGTTMAAVWTTVEALVGIDGKVDDVQVADGSGYAALDSVALEAARRARYKPGTQSGVPIPVWTRLTYRFPPRRK
jgi:TonB family protein